jgi:hypothetical protein
MRREGLRTKNNWENTNAEYNIERYRKHYFYSDFDYLKSKFENGTPPAAMIIASEGKIIREYGKANLVENCLQQALKDHGELGETW